MKVLLYGASVGVFSARKLSRACDENLAFQFLTGLQSPAFKTFIEFRERHREDMATVFVQTVKLAKELGLTKLGSVALDGTKITANTSKHKAMSYGRMQEEEKRLKEEIGKLLKQGEEADAAEDREFGKDRDGYSLEAELARRSSRLKKIEEARAALEAREAKDHPEEAIDVKKQISFADRDARCFSKTSDGTRYVYNAQAAVDMDSQIILENHIENTVSDARAAGTTIQTMKETLGGVPTALVADSGYANKTTLAACEAEGVTPVCSPGREGHEATEEKREGLEAFSYDARKDEFCCPHGRVYKFDGGGGDMTAKVYRSEAGRACGCGRLTKGGGSVIRVRACHLARRTFYRLLDVPENQALYRRRKCTVEPVFGQIKFGMGFQRFLHRGTMKVRGEWNMVCAAFNLRKMVTLMKVKSPGGEATTTPPGVPGLGRRVSCRWSRFLAHCQRLCGFLIAPINDHVELLAQRG